MKSNGGKGKTRLTLFLILFAFSLISTVMYLTLGQLGKDDVLVVLSGEFLKWNVNLPIDKIPVRDVSDYYSNFYVYFGPLSSIIFMPFVLIFGTSFPQVSLGVFSMIFSFVIVFFISRYFKFDKVDSLWLSLFFVFSTVLFSSSVVNITAWQVEAFGVPFILLSLWAYFYKKHSILIGLFISLAVLTRFTLIFAVVFFLAELIYKRLTLRQFIILLIPVAISVIMLGAYNNHRFHSFFETGYNYNISKNDGPIAGNYKYGQVNILHIPSNLYSFLIMSPEPVLEKFDQGMNLKFPYLRADGWGVAIWFTSPLFLYLLTNFKKGKHTVSASFACILLAMPVFLWYSIGFAQFGYRYALDFLPFLFLILLPSLAPRITKNAIILITVGVIFNLIYATSLFGFYPLLNIKPY